MKYLVPAKLQRTEERPQNSFKLQWELHCPFLFFLRRTEVVTNSPAVHTHLCRDCVYIAGLDLSPAALTPSQRKLNFAEAMKVGQGDRAL